MRVDEGFVMSAILDYPKIKRAVETVSRAKFGAKGDMVRFFLDDNSNVMASFNHEDYDFVEVLVSDVVDVMNGNWGFRL